MTHVRCAAGHGIESLKSGHEFTIAIDRMEYTTWKYKYQSDLPLIFQDVIC
jgi:hypothetical protein